MHAENGIAFIDSCKHTAVDSGVCTLCGLCLDESPLVVQPSTYKETNMNTCAKQPRFQYHAVRNPLAIYDRAIDRILIPLSLTACRAQIKAILFTTQFPHRHSHEDKALLALYRYAKLAALPLALGDLLPFTRLKKHRFLLCYRDTFPFVPDTPAYLAVLYEKAATLYNGHERSAWPGLPDNSLVNAKSANPTVDSATLSTASLLAHLPAKKRRAAMRTLSVPVRRKLTGILRRL